MLAGTAKKTFSTTDLLDEANLNERERLNATFFDFEDIYFDSPEREAFIKESGIGEEVDDFGWYAEFGYTACQGIQMVQLATDAGLSAARIAEYKHYAENMRAANIEMLMEWKENENRNQFGVNNADAPDALRIDQCDDDCNGGTFLDFFGGERDTSYRSPSDGGMSPKHHTPYIYAMDDSLDCFLDVTKCTDRMLLQEGRLGGVETSGRTARTFPDTSNKTVPAAARKSQRAAAAKLWRARVNVKQN